MGLVAGREDDEADEDDAPPLGDGWSGVTASDDDDEDPNDDEDLLLFACAGPLELQRQLPGPDSDELCG